MGYLYYGDSIEGIEVPDLLLSHLKVVITTKLRRRESFTLTWRHDLSGSHGRSSLWLQESIPLRFSFTRSTPDELKPSVLQEFTHMANSSAGLTVNLDEWLEEPIVEPLPEREAVPSAA
ncbi:hypothetical protein ACH3VR_16480 [Microbacterium sp. B2969]|uniref:DUF7882 domain-containing protein n=1 Tax=Microbacterium alkaliflavum TaxID=3248839 RepID=A0ABW7QAQ2_9MICO